MRRNVRNLDVDAGTETRSQIRGASEDVAQMFIPHVFVAGLLHQRFNLREKSEKIQEDDILS